MTHQSKLEIMPVNEPRLIKLFKELCLINAPARQEREVADFVIDYLTEMGLEVTEDEAGQAVGGNSGNIVSRLPANTPDLPKIFLSAHLDTVEPTAGLTIIEDNGTLKSDGTTILGADDKGGMAPAIEAIRMLQESNQPHGDVYLLFSICEEVGLLGAENLKLKDLNLDFGYVLDTGPPVGSFVTRTATHDKLNVTITGKPAHAGKDPEHGINAIQVVADAISNMKLGRIDPDTTANFGIIKGGTAVNVVCPSVTLFGEARSTNVESLNRQIDHMIHTLTEAANQWGAQINIEHKRHYDSYTVPDDAKVVQVAQRASRSMGLEPTLRTTLGGSDANKYNTMGVPTIVVATGMEKIHTHEEFITIKDLVDTAELTYRIVLESAKLEPEQS